MRFRPSTEDLKGMIVNTDHDIYQQELEVKLYKERAQRIQTKLLRSKQILKRLKEQLQLEKSTQQNALENECIRNKGESL